MKYVMVSAPDEATDRQKEIDWTYVCEGSAAVRVGDSVVGQFGYDDDQIMKVVATGVVRAKLPVRDGQIRYMGPLKVVRLATRTEIRLAAEVGKRWAAVNRAEQRALAAEETLMDYRDRNFTRVS